MTATKHPATTPSTGPTIIGIFSNAQHVTVITSAGEYVIRMLANEDAKSCLVRYGREQLEAAQRMVRHSDIYFKAADTL